MPGCAKNVTDSTNFLDAAGTASSSYTVSAVIKGTEGEKSPAVKVWAQQYLSIPIQAPSGSYTANDASPGDLDGDGKLDIVLKWDPSNSKDSGAAGTTDPVYVDGLKMDGTRLWRINIGMNIRAGAHDTQMSVYDFDGDGKAEVAFKTAPGTKDGTGAFLKTGPAAGADNTKDYRIPRGMVLTGPEWFTVFDGTTGAERATIEYPVLYGSTPDWGDPISNELESGTSITKDGGGTLLSCGQCSSNNSTKSTPTLTADMLGDWREEIIWRETAGGALRLYTTTDVTKRRIYTLMHDATYRAQVNFEQSSYNQPPHVGFHMGAGMADPPKPDIFLK